MAYIIVAYYTENTGYAQEVQHLINSLEKLKLLSDVVAIPNQGSWQENTSYKPYFLQQMLHRHFPKDILYLDADARVQQYPLLFDKVDFDIGVVYWKGKELLAGTLYLANNFRVAEILERWVKGCIANPSAWDSTILQYILDNCPEVGLKVKNLPLNYCQIFDLMRDAGDPVIEHFQASRRFKSSLG